MKKLAMLLKIGFHLLLFLSQLNEEDWPFLVLGRKIFMKADYCLSLEDKVEKNSANYFANIKR
jgi:hypothetical protein